MATSAQELRRALRVSRIAAREALSTEEREVHTRAIVSHLRLLLQDKQPRILGFCWPWRGEVDLRELVSAWLAEDTARCAAIPTINTANATLQFREWEPHCVMAEGPHGIPAPANTPARHPELLLIPVNAFDEQGYRLGYGGGYFDRTLVILSPRPYTVGVGFELARVDSVQPQKHDIALDTVVTEKGALTAPLRSPHPMAKTVKVAPPQCPEYS